MLDIFLLDLNISDIAVIVATVLVKETPRNLFDVELISVSMGININENRVYYSF